MPSDLTLQKVTRANTASPAPVDRETAIMMSHKKAANLSLEERFPNIHGENDLSEIRDVAQQFKTASFGAPAALASGAADVTAMATAVIYNLANMAQGEDWAWPEDFRNVPATSDWWGAKMGLTKEQTDSLAFIGGGVALSPTKMVDEKLLCKALKTAKAF